MKLFLSLFILLNSLAFTIPLSVSAQDLTVPAQIRQAVQARIPARLRQRDRAVTIVRPADIHPTANLSIEANSTGPTTPGNIQSRVPTPQPPQGMGSIQANPPGKLNITLTAKRPAIEHRAYLSYHYPQQIYMSEANNHIVYSKGNIPGALYYSVKLDKDKKYLIEIMADPWGTSGGKVSHKVGDEVTIHEFGTFNVKINISRVVSPQENGWVSGTLMQDSPAANQWRVYSVSFTEMD